MALCLEVTQRGGTGLGGSQKKQYKSVRSALRFGGTKDLILQVQWSSLGSTMILEMILPLKP